MRTLVVSLRSGHPTRARPKQAESRRWQITRSINDNGRFSLRRAPFIAVVLVTHGRLVRWQCPHRSRAARAVADRVEGHTRAAAASSTRTAALARWGHDPRRVIGHRPQFRQQRQLARGPPALSRTGSRRRREPLARRPHARRRWHGWGHDPRGRVMGHRPPFRQQRQLARRQPALSRTGAGAHEGRLARVPAHLGRLLDEATGAAPQRRSHLTRRRPALSRTGAGAHARPPCSCPRAGRPCIVGPRPA
jgi:hypothetical protein